MSFQITLPAEEAVEFVPDYGDNRERAADGRKPFVVKLMPMTGAEYDRLHSSMYNGKRISNATIMKRSQAFVKRLVEENVVEVTGFEVCNSQGEVVQRPSNGVELYKVVMELPPAASSIIDDVVEAIKDASVLSEGELKNLRARSGSSPPKTRPSGTGLAKDAKANPTRTTEARPESSSSSGSDLANSSDLQEIATAKRTQTSPARSAGIEN